MRDICTESVIPICPRTIDKIAKIVLIVLVGVSLVLFLMNGLLWLIVSAVLVYLLYQVLQKTDAEYDYVHTNNVFDVDLVIAGTRRKSITSINLDQVIILAPISAEEMVFYEDVPVSDYTGNTDEQPIFAMIHTQDGKQKKLLLRLDQRMQESLRQRIPGKMKCSDRII